MTKMIWMGTLSVLALILVGIALLAGAAFAVAGAMGMGTPGNACHAPSGTASASPGTPHTSPTPGNGGESFCFPASPEATAVVGWATAMANALYVNPACGKRRGAPNCNDTWYTSAFPQAVIRYGQQWCQAHGDCTDWANGSYQCVSFVRGAYSQVDPMKLTNDAFNLWATYQNQPGWQEIPAEATADLSQRALPEPGDVMVMKDPPLGHVAIILTVTPPENGQTGLITFANSNSSSAYDHMPLLPNLLVDTREWDPSGEIVQVWGYIRPKGTTAQRNVDSPSETLSTKPEQGVAAFGGTLGEHDQKRLPGANLSATIRKREGSYVTG